MSRVLWLNERSLHPKNRKRIWKLAGWRNGRVVSGRLRSTPFKWRHQKLDLLLEITGCFGQTLIWTLLPDLQWHRLVNHTGANSLDKSPRWSNWIEGLFGSVHLFGKRLVHRIWQSSDSNSNWNLTFDTRQLKKTGGRRWSVGALFLHSWFWLSSCQHMRP